MVNLGKNKVRVRFAPSPTGMMHLGSLRTALYNYFFAKHNGGDFLLRIEDTDQTRFVPGAINNIVNTLKWAGMDYDEGPIVAGDVVTERGEHGPYIQSRRLPIYKKYADELIAKGLAYPCFCTTERLDKLREEQTLLKKPPGYDGHCRNLSFSEIEARRTKKVPEVIRMKMPREGATKFNDLIRGEIEFKNELLDDQVLIKSDGFPTYHLAVVIDDHLMEITHVIRGEEWLSSTPKHIKLYEFFGWKPTEYAHLPLMLKPGGGKLSKRDMASSVSDYINQGYLKPALLNFIALLGWHPPGDVEKLTAQEMINVFDLKNVGKSGAVFMTDKLDWLNGAYIRELPIEELAELCRPYLEKAGFIGEGYSEEKIGAIVKLEQARIKKLSEIVPAVEYFFSPPAYDKSKLVWKKQTPENAAERLIKVKETLSNLDLNSWEPKTLENTIKQIITASATPVGETLWPMRVALSGRDASPGPFDIAAVLGKTETIRRLEAAISALK
jgi:glutamyl-tRNA synthetase